MAVVVALQGASRQRQNLMVREDFGPAQLDHTACSVVQLSPSPGQRVYKEALGLSKWCSIRCQLLENLFGLGSVALSDLPGRCCLLAFLIWPGGHVCRLQQGSARVCWKRQESASLTMVQ